MPSASRARSPSHDSDGGRVGRPISSPTSLFLRVETATLPDDANSDWERRSLLRAFRQELESLARAGLDRVPAAPHVEGPATTVTPGEPASHERPAVSASFRAADGSEPPAHADSNQWLLQADPQQSSAAPRPARELPAAAPPSSLLGPIFKEPEFETPPVPACDRPALLETLASRGGRMPQMCLSG